MVKYPVEDIIGYSHEEQRRHAGHPDSKQALNKVRY